MRNQIIVIDQLAIKLAYIAPPRYILGRQYIASAEFLSF